MRPKGQVKKRQLHAYLVLKEPTFARCATVGRPANGLPDVALAKSGSLKRMPGL